MGWGWDDGWMREGVCGPSGLDSGTRVIGSSCRIRTDRLELLERGRVDGSGF